MEQNGKWVVITGASTGIGRVCALHLARLGYQVVAGVRKLESQDASIAGIRWMRIDVTDTASIAAAACEIKSLAGDGLCGLVNNAGIGVAGPVEFVSIEDWRRQFEVNVFGQIAVTQAMLPLLRAHVAAHGKGTGRIVMMGSIAGKVAQPIVGPYCASKFAMEAVSDSLRLELREQGIHTVLIEPGAIQSEIWRKGQAEADGIGPDHPARKLYGAMIDKVARAVADAGRNALPAEMVARAVVDALQRRVPRTRYVIGKSARMAAFLKRVLPDRVWDAMLRRAFGM